MTVTTSLVLANTNFGKSGFRFAVVWVARWHIFKPKSQFGSFLERLAIEDVDIFNGLLVYFTAIWSILPQFDIHRYFDAIW
jgi:hypothetical protein